MATSGSIDYLVTRDDIITEALELLGVLGEGVSPNANQLSSSARTLNMLVKYWQADGLNLFSVNSQTVDLVAGTGSYTLSPRPIRVLNVFRRDADNNDYPVELITRDEWLRLPNKSDQGTPLYAYYDPQVGTGNKLYVWQIPEDTTYDLIVHYARTLDDFDASADDADYPQEWYLPLAYNLAVALAPKYGTPSSKLDRLVQMATAYKEAAEGFDREGMVYFAPTRGAGVRP